MHNNRIPEKSLAPEHLFYLLSEKNHIIVFLVIIYLYTGGQTVISRVIVSY